MKISNFFIFHPIVTKFNEVKTLIPSRTVIFSRFCTIMLASEFVYRIASIHYILFLSFPSKAAATARRTLALGRHDRLAFLGVLAGTGRTKVDGRFPIAAGSLYRSSISF